MNEHLSLAVLVLALASGLVTSVATSSQLQKQQPVFFRYFLSNILFFNLLILSAMVVAYLQLPLQSVDLLPYAGIIPAMLLLLAALKMAWLYVFILMNRALPTDVMPRQLSKILVRSGSGLFIVFSGLLIMAWLYHLEDLFNLSINTFEFIIIGGALLAAMWLVKTALHMPLKPRRVLVLVFGWYHLGLLGSVLLVLLLGWFKTGPQSSAQLFINGVLLILYNLFPLVWLRWWRPVQSDYEKEKFDLYAITKREREIISLIKEGKTNQEIADKLFISLATVKDHNHNIFKKCGTRNRLELARLFQ